MFDPRTRTVLVLTGLKQSGKDYMISRLRERLQGDRRVIRLSFSDELRDISNYLFPWCPVNPDNKEKDLPIPHLKNKNNLTPRDIWKIIAHDKNGLCSIQEDILLDLFLRNQLLNEGLMSLPDAVYVISDLRKRVEWEMVSQYGFKIIRIVNPADQRPIKEDDVERLVPHFKVDFEIMNLRNEESVDQFMRAVQILYPFLNLEK